VVESTALEMRRTRKGTVGSNPTLSATDPAHWSLNGGLANNRRLSPVYSRPIGPGTATSCHYQARTRAHRRAQSPPERWSVPFACFACLTGKIQRFRVWNR
jgi:hypothetical protein